jgi:hypothetical protein
MAVQGTDLVAAAKKFLGVPYHYGGTGMSGIDCSALMQDALKANGINAPRTSQAQWGWVNKITASQLQPGDLIFTQGSDGTRTRPGHVFMYAGGGKVVEAAHTGTNVRIRSFDPATEHGLIGFGRAPGMNSAVKGAQPAPGTSSTAQNAGWSPFQIPDQITSAFTAGEEILQKLMWLINPENWVRIIAGVMGLLLAGAGIWTLAASA